MSMNHGAYVFYRCCNGYLDYSSHNSGTRVIHIIRCKCDNPRIIIKACVSDGYGGFLYVKLERFSRGEVENLRDQFRKENVDMEIEKNKKPLHSEDVPFHYMCNYENESKKIRNLVLSDIINVDFQHYYYRLKSVINDFDDPSYDNYAESLNFSFPNPDDFLKLSENYYEQENFLNYNYNQWNLYGKRTYFLDYDDIDF